jgi:O-antigen/teichoic acid export membrane protein
MSKAFTPDHARVMRNTALLYFRMALMMCINLYTSRVVLQVLGVEDYGIFYVVWGIAYILNFINSSMTASTQRFLNFELGTGNKQRLHEIFITSVHIHFILSLLLVLLCETGGVWFLTEKMVIPDERRMAAMWCFQLSIVTAVAEVMSCPYQSVIIAREKMSAFAYISILDAFLKLAIVGMLLLTGYDRLIVYAILYTCEKLLIRLVYNIYCKRHFEESRYQWFYEKGLFRKMLSFAGWSMLGNLSYVLNTQGLNMLLNVFFGPIVNAAQAAASQAKNAANQFSRNFQVAINPQITKSYAAEQLQEMHLLIFRGSRLTFCLLLMLCLPLAVETPMVLNLWLKEVPEGTTGFLRLLLVILIVDQMSSPLVAAIAATGNIKKYQIFTNGIKIFIMPAAYIVLKMGGAPWTVFVVYLLITILAYISIIQIVLPRIHMDMKDYFIHVLKPCACVLFLSLITPIIMKQLTGPGILFSFLTITITVIITGVLCFTLGIDKEMRKLIISKVRKIKGGRSL